MNRATHSLSLAVRRARTRHAPDDRVAVFDVAIDRSTAVPTLRGVVSEPYLKERTLAAARDVTDEFDAAIRVLDGSRRTVGVAVAPVRSGPSADAEQVTQVLRGAAVVVYEGSGGEDSGDDEGWVRIRAPDGYIGWVESADLTDVAADSSTGPEHAVRRRIDAGSTTLHAGTDVAIEAVEDGRAIGRLRTGEPIEIPADAVSRPETPDGDEVVEVAKQFLGTEYVWGGMTTEGIDCSGLVWVAYYISGIVLPRDADQQRAMGPTVARDALEPGDLLFFPGHVAIGLGGDDYIHAHGDDDAVVVNSLDPDAANYHEPHDDTFEMAIRVVPRGGDGDASTNAGTGEGTDP